jgi:AGZA family xanthine/uracil permease-like MFS transporter
MMAGLTPLPAGVASLPPSPAPIAFKLDIVSALQLSLWSSIFSFMFVDLFNSLGTLLAVCREAGIVDDRGGIPGLSRMFTADALATVGGALLGTSTTTMYVESASGVSDGGRTGLTGVVTGLLFFLATFFTPLIGAIPAYATAPALVIIGIFMMRGIGQIDFYSFDECAPAFLTLLLMSLTYSIATGLAFGFIAYVLIKLCLGRIRECDSFLIGVALLSLISLMV